MKTFEKSSLIHCQIEDLFAFHLDLNNLKIITPKDTKVTLLNEMFTPKEGDILRLHTVKNFIPMIWEVKIDRIEFPHLLVDVALKSPFTFWKHSHIFTDRGDGVCELKDVVDYIATFGFLGRYLDAIVRQQLNTMFRYRHKRTKEILER
jgi:ligand-binding SRPBCC domain-containing protein